MDIHGHRGELRMGYALVASLGRWNVESDGVSFSGMAELGPVADAFLLEQGKGFVIQLEMGSRGPKGRCISCTIVDGKVYFCFNRENNNGKE